MSQKVPESGEAVPAALQRADEHERGSPVSTEEDKSENSEGENPQVTGETQPELVCYYLFLTKTEIYISCFFFKSPIATGLEFVDNKDVEQYVIGREQQIPINDLVLDKDRKWGQIRPLSQSIVTYYYQSLLTKGAPDVPPYAPMRRTNGVCTFYLYQIMVILFSLQKESSCR